MKVSWRVKRALWPMIVTRFPQGVNVTYSQFGEDRILTWLLAGDVHAGSYMEIGAYDPIMLSNTYGLYCKGWRGTTVEPDPRRAARFRAFRSGDMHLELGVVPEPGASIRYYCFERDTHNTFDIEMAERYKQEGMRLVEECVIPTISMVQLMERHYQQFGSLEVLSIDVEGLDDALLRANDWQSYRPKILIFECHEMTPRNVASHPVNLYLEERGYFAVATCGPSHVFTEGGAIPVKLHGNSVVPHS